MLRAISFLVSGLIATAVQGVLLYAGLPPAAVPQLVTVLVVYLAFTEMSILGATLAFGLGLILDFSSVLLVGPWAGAFAAVYGCLAVFSHHLFIESPAVAAVTSFVAVLLADTVYMFLAYEYHSVSWEYPTQALGQACATALVAPFLIGYLTRRFRRKGAASMGRSGAMSVG